MIKILNQPHGYFCTPTSKLYHVNNTYYTISKADSVYRIALKVTLWAATFLLIGLPYLALLIFSTPKKIQIKETSKSAPPLPVAAIKLAATPLPVAAPRIMTPPSPETITRREIPPLRVISLPDAAIQILRPAASEAAASDPVKLLGQYIAERNFSEAAALFNSMENKGPWTKTLLIESGDWYAPPIEKKVSISILGMFCEEVLKQRSPPFSISEEKDFLELVNSSILQLGPLSFSPITIAGTSQYPLNALLDALLSGSRNPLQELMCVIMIQGKASLSHNYRNIIRNSQALFSSQFITFLRDQGLLIDITEESIPRDPALLSQLLAHATEDLLQRARLAHTCPARLDLAEMEKYHLLKKGAKEALRADIPALREPYQHFVLAYDFAVSKSPTLLLLRQISKELRIYLTSDVKPKLSPKLIKFFAMMNPSRVFNKSHFATRAAIQENPVIYKSNFIEIRKRIISATWAIFNDPLQDKHILMNATVHGTKLSTARIIMKSTPHALLSSNDLIAKKIPTFNGQLSSAKYRQLDPRTGETVEINSLISGEILEPTWAYPYWEDGQALRGAPTRTLTSVLYALPSHNEHASMSSFFNPVVSKARLSNLQANLCKSGDDPFWWTVLWDIIRLRITDDAFEPIGQSLISIITPLLPSYPHLQKLHEALTGDLPFLINAAEFSQLKQEQDEPVIFVTFCHNPTPLETGGAVFFLPSGLILGADIPLVITLEENISRMQEVFGPYGIQVRGVDWLISLEMLRMTEGDLLPETLPLETPEAFQSTLEQTLRTQVAPHYARPLPKTPFYSRDASSTHLSNPMPIQEIPFYGPEFKEDQASYLSAVEAGRAPARSLHGLVHMYQCAIWSQMVQNIQEFFGTPKQMAFDRLLTLLAAGYHDSRRQTEGSDFWDGESATLFRTFLDNQLIPQTTVDLPLMEKRKKEFFEAIARKNDVETSGSLDPLKIAIHDPDCIEFLRIFGLARFDSSRLAISKILPSDELSKLISECNHFITITSNPTFKATIEYESDHPYFDLMHMLKGGPYPTIQKWLATEFASIPD